MDLESSMKKILILSSIKNGLFDYSVLKKINNEKFYEQNNELSPILFDYFLYKLILYRLSNNLSINSNIIIISEEFFNNKEKNLNIEENKAFSDKIIIIPYLDESTKKWGIIFLFNLYNDEKEIIAKIITTNNNNDDIDIILNSLIKKIRASINNKERKFTFDIFNINLFFITNVYLVKNEKLLLIIKFLLQVNFL